MHASPAAFAPVQLHSPDGRVRLRHKDLLAILLEHVCTVQDHAVLDDISPEHRTGVAAAGITEWQGHAHGRVVALGWDWLCLHDGAVVPSFAIGPRSNVMLLDDLGYDAGIDATDAALWGLIHATPWQRRAEDAFGRVLCRSIQY